jgi:hypothetical protein
MDPRDCLGSLCIPNPGLPYTELVDIVHVAPKVFFVASCNIGDVFRSLFDIDLNTPDRVMVVPEGGPTAPVDLYWASLGWIQFAIEASKPNKSVFDALKKMNTWLENNAKTKNDAGEIVPVSIRFQAIGGNNGRNVFAK